ncbi:MAG: rhomboid family intramembrane serine protease [Prevotella sp.]
MRNIPVITKNLLIINVLVYLVNEVLGRGLNMNDVFGLHFFLAPDFQIYQLFTYMFMHAGFMHLFLNMFALWMFGCVVENVWGPRKFLIYYLVCGMGAGLFQEAAQMLSFSLFAGEHMQGVDLLTAARLTGDALNTWTTVGASGAVYAILLAFGMIFPEERIFIFPLPVPIKAKWFVVLYAGIELIQALSSSGDGVAHLAHLGGMVFGFFLIRYWRRHPDSRYNRNGGRQFFDTLRSSWQQHKGSGKFGSTRSTNGQSTTTHNPDWDYNAKKKQQQAEVDRILDKIRRNGYDSLTKDEKQTLFDNCN